jgi:hypothetical protein
MSDLAKHYNITTDVPPCATDCKYLHYDQYPPTATNDSVLTKVQQLADKMGLTKSQTQHFVKKIKADQTLK